MAIMKTGMICHIRGSNDECRVIGKRFDGLVFRTESPRTATFYMFNAGSVVFNLNLQYRIISIERLRHLKGFLVIQKHK